MAARKVSILTVASKPYLRVMTVEFRFNGGEWRGSTYFPGYFIGSRRSLTEKVQKRLRRFARQWAKRHTLEIGPRVAYRVVVHTKNRLGVTTDTYGPDIRYEYRTVQKGKS